MRRRRIGASCSTAGRSTGAPSRCRADLELVVCHTGSPRHLDGSGVQRAAAASARRRSPRSRADRPGDPSLRDVTPELLGRRRRPAGPGRAIARAEHVVTENARVAETVDALEAGDLDAVGRLFAASHASLRDLFEVSSPELDAMVEIATGVPGVVAARMTGAGFGGCTVNLVRPDAVEALRAAVERDYPAMTGLSPRVLPWTRSTAPAGSR